MDELDIQNNKIKEEAKKVKKQKNNNIKQEIKENYKIGIEYYNDVKNKE